MTMATKVKTSWLLAAVPAVLLSGAARAQESGTDEPAPAEPAPAEPSLPEPAEPAPDATQAAEAPPVCDGDVTDRAPDPRCGETLDGREAQLPPGSTAGKAALYVPKQLAKGAVWPLWKGADFVENHHIADWYRAILTSDDGKVGVRPELNITTGLLPTIGAHFFYRRMPDDANLTATAVTAGAPVFFGMLSYTSPNWLGLAATASYEHRTDRVFAGTGANSESDLSAMGQAVSRYGSNIARGDLGWVRELPQHFQLLAHGGIKRTDYESDNVRGGPSVTSSFGLAPVDCMAIGQMAPCVNPAAMPGFYSGQRVLHGGFGVGFDSRNRLRGGSGFNAVVDATGGYGVGDDPTRDVRFTGEFTGALAGTDRALLLRGYASTVSNLSDSPLPFDELVSPTGNHFLRGFLDGRFRGQSDVVATVEYRYYIAWDIDATVFSDVGTVAGETWSGIGSSQWFPDFGMGLRFYTPQGRHWEAAPNSGAQVTYAPDGGFRLLFSLAGF
jgi:hypothetical protein